MIQLAVIAVYLVLLLALGVFSNRLFRGTSRDYTLASQTIGPFFLLMSLFGTTMTAFALVGSTNEAYRAGAIVYGMLASAGGIVHSLCFFVIGVKLWSFGRRLGYTTQIQFFRQRLDSNLIGLLLFPVLVGLVIPYLLIGVVSSGDFINEVSAGAFEPWGWFAADGHALPRWLASLIICLVVLTYVFFGGMRGTAWANALQTMFFMTLGVVTFVVIANKLGGGESFLENLRAASQKIPLEKRAAGGFPKAIYFSFLLIPLSVAMFPHVFQHWLTAKSAASFKLPIVAHPVFVMIVWLPCVLIGVWAAGNHAALTEPIPDKKVLASLVQQLAPPLLGGLLTAGILAAIMSSLDSQFLCLGTMFTTDIVLHYGAKDRFSERQKVLLARGFIVAIVGITYALSLTKGARGVFPMAIWCFSGFTGLFPLVLAAAYWKRLTAAGAMASVVATVAVWGSMFYAADFAAKPYVFPAQPITLAAGWSIPPMMPIVTVFLASATALVVVSLVTRPPRQATLEKFFR